jgi:ABC-type nitrate/sulfonate/bicarbonate transport system ATPase subunit
MIEIINLSKNFGKKKVIEGFSLNVEKGERISLVGASGSGKTTLLRIVSGLDKRYDGEVKCQGKVSYMFQEDRLFEFSTL